MKYRVLGKIGIAVSELCIGTMTFGNTTNEQDSIWAQGANDNVRGTHHVT